MTDQVSGSLSPTWGTQVVFLTPGLSIGIDPAVVAI